MKRPRQHVISTESEKQLEAALPSKCFVPRRQPEDYGIDHEIEYFRDGETTGVIFKGQLKGTESATRLKSGKAISYSEMSANLDYVCNELRIPVIYFLADVGTGETWWYSPQTDSDLRSRLKQALKKKQTELTIHFPTANTLPETLDQLLAEVTRANISLATRTLADTPLPQFQDVITRENTIDKVIDELQDKADILRIEKIGTLIADNDLDEALDSVRRILQGGSQSTATRVAALLQEEDIRSRLLIGEGKGESEIEQVALEIAARLRSATRRGPTRLRFVAAIHYSSTVLGALTRQDFSLFMNWTALQKTRDSMGLFVVSQARRDVATKIVRRFSFCKRLLLRALEARAAQILPDGIARIVLSMRNICLRLQMEGMNKEATHYRASLLELCDMGVEIGENLTHDSGYELFKGSFCDSCPDCNPRPFEWKWTEDFQREVHRRHAHILRWHQSVE